MKPPTRALDFRVDLDSEDALQGFLMMNASVEGLEETSDGMLRVFIPDAEWTEEFKGDLSKFLETLPDRSTELVSSEAIADRDWNAEWEASIEPIAATQQLVITPSWNRQEAQQLDLPFMIVIDPKMSFGTGHHETTRLCLQAVEKISAKSKSVLDLGTGSGVLAMYALMRGATHAVGVDTDTWSVENVEENRELNGFNASTFEVRLGDLFTAVDAAERFDLIFANIHRNILLEVADQLILHAQAGAHLILSGLLIYDVEEVRTRYEAVGFRLVEELREQEWAALLLERATG